jgi:hypothetical protein
MSNARVHLDTQHKDNHSSIGSTKKNILKPINMWSSFEDLEKGITNVKTICNLDLRFYFI